MDNNTDNNIITFIIPTIGRETLKNTLISLQNQKGNLLFLAH